MDAKPFRSLSKPRLVNRPELPDDLAAFYSRNEGVGVNAPNDHAYDLCLLGELGKVGWPDIEYLIGSVDERRWKGAFEGIQVGRSMFGDLLVYVIESPWSAPKSIVAIGPDIAGNEGVGPTWWEAVLVFAPSFAEWIARLERFDWVEYGLTPGEITALPAAQQVEIRSYFKSLNPRISWGSGESP